MSNLAKTILITGASTGFGRDTAETLTREGYIVFASFRDTAVRNKSHAEALRSAGINVVELDVAKSESPVRSALRAIPRSRTMHCVQVCHDIERLAKSEEGLSFVWFVALVRAIKRCLQAFDV